MSKSNEQSLAVQQEKSEEDKNNAEMAQDFIEMEGMKKLAYQQEVINNLFGSFK